MKHKLSSRISIPTLAFLLRNTEIHNFFLHLFVYLFQFFNWIAIYVHNRKHAVFILNRHGNDMVAGLNKL